VTAPMTLPRSTRTTLSQRAALLAAVLAAKVLARQKPHRIRAVLTKLRRGARPANLADVTAARNLVTTTSARRAGRRGCLERSLATVLLCRLRGTTATWCVGVRVRPPTEAHAWVEVDGKPVGEPTGTSRAYARIMTS
jgi:chorismate mutase